MPPADASPREHGAFAYNGVSRIEKFDAKVEKNGPLCERLGTRCWIWNGARTPNGYGRVANWRNSRDARGNNAPMSATRIAWALEHNRWPEPSDVVRHRCDNPPCVNPAHLEIGTHLDNMRDAKERGRNPLWRLQGERAEVIKRMLREYPQRNMSEIAMVLGCTREYVRQIFGRLEREGLLIRCEYVLAEDLSDARRAELAERSAKK